MIRAIIFDCFGVLYADASHRFYEEQVQDDKTRQELWGLNKQSDYGFITREEWVKAVADVLQLDESFVAANLQRKHTLNQPLVDFSQSLRPTYKLGMLSNIGIGAMDEFFTPNERARLFDAVVLSHEVGLIKPHPEIFHIMAERLGCSPGECVMIDDLEDNCAGADAAGMQAIHYKTNQQLIQDLTVLLGENNA